MSRNGNTNLATVVSNPEVVGAGGWMTGAQVAADGTLLGRCDTAVPYRLDPGSSAWVREFVPGQTVAVADFRVDGGVATFGAAILWSNSAIRALDWGGYVWIKKAGATQYVRTSLARNVDRGPNSNHRMCGNPLEFDPANENVLWQGDHTGVRYTADGGTNWTNISTSTIPVPTSSGNGPHRYIIRFDRSSAVTGGRTQRLYVFSPGSGWYRSNDAGVTWTFLNSAGMPTSAACAKVHPTSGLLVSTGLNIEGDGPVKIWNGTTWTTGTREGGASLNLHAAEFDPNNAGRIYGIAQGGGVTLSNDNGATWFDISAPSQTAATVDIPWQVSNGGDRAVSDIIFNPADGRLYVPTGIGCWRFPTPLFTFTNFNIQIPWEGIARGIENMVTSAIMRSPSGKTAIGMQDKQWMFFGPDELGKKFADNYGPRRGVILRGACADYAPEDENFWAVTYQRHEDKDCAYTEDFGKTWNDRSQLAAQTGGNGSGQIVVLSKDIWIRGQFMVQANDAAAWSGGAPGSGTRIASFNASVRAQNALYITRNARDPNPTWTEIVIGNGNAVVPHYNSDQVRISLMKDPYTPGRVIFYNPSDVDYPTTADAVACRGIWMIDVNLTSAVPPTVTRLRDTRLWGFSQDFFHMKLRHGGAANTFLLAGGDNALGAYRGVITGNTLTITELTGTDNLGIGTRFGEVHGISASKGRNGSTTPAIRVQGYRITSDWYDDGIDFSKYGDWESADNGVTWTRLAQFPANGPPSTIPASGSGMLFNDGCSSMHKSGEMTVTTGGQGAAHQFEQYRRRAV